MGFAGVFFALAPLLGLLIFFIPRKFKYKEVVALTTFVFVGFISFISLIQFTENSIKLRFEHADFLWLTLFLPISILLWYFSVNIINRWQNYASLILRVLLISLLIIAISGVRIVRKHDKLTVIFLIDRSESMPKELSYDWYKNYIKTKISRSQHRKPEDLYGIVLFAGRSTVFQYPTNNPNISGFEPEHLDTEITDIGAAIRQSLTLFPEDSRKRLVIVTDGNSNKGDLFRDVSLAINQNVAVDVVTHESEKKLLDVRIERFTTPMRITKDTPFEIRLSINSTANVRAKVLITRNGEQIDDMPAFIVDLKPGNNYPVLPLQVLNYNGFYEYNAQIQVLSDLKGEKVEDVIPENNSGKNFVIVKGSAKILLIYGDKEQDNIQMIQALQRGGKQLDIRHISDMPSSNAHAQFGFYDLVILSNISSSQWTSEQMNAMKSAIHDSGVGMIMFGGDKSYAPGGYQDQPIVEALPVDMDIKEKRIIPAGALVIIMHTCEMPAGNKYAKIIARTVMQTMSARDEFGIVIYSYTSGVQWLFPLRKVGNNKQALVNLIDKAPPEDMPDFDPAIALAYKALLNSNAGMKHCIVISDGDPSLSSNSLKLVQSAYQDAGITTSGVCIFPEGAGTSTLQRIVQVGGPTNDAKGRFWLINKTSGINTLPKIFIREAARIKTQYNQNKKISGFSTEPAEFLKYLRQSTTDGKLDGFTLTSLKPGASLPIAVDEEDTFPLLAYWQYGLGKVACFTSDVLSNGWGSKWVNGTPLNVRIGKNQMFDLNFTKFINDLASFSSRKVVTTHQIGSRAEYRSGTGVFTINRIDSRGRYVNLRELDVKVISPKSVATKLKMREIRPGELEGEFDAFEEGIYQIVSTYKTANNKLAYLENGLSVPYPVEYRSFSVNDRELIEIVRQSGGKFAKSQLRAVSIQDTGNNQPTGSRTLSEYEYGVDTLRNHDNSIILDDKDIPKIYEPFSRDTKPTYSYLPTWILFAVIALSMLFFDIFIRRVQMNPTFLPILASKIPILKNYFKKEDYEKSEEILLLQSAKLEAKKVYEGRVSRLKKSGYSEKTEDEKTSGMIADLKKNAKKALKDEEMQIRKQLADKKKLEKKQLLKETTPKPAGPLDALQKAKNEALKKRKK